jgi:putative effector of murein hydrolase LrgA (UPF0299 family)
VIRKTVAALLRFAWKLVAVILVTLLVLFVIGWLVDVLVDPAEEEIRSGVSRIGAENAELASQA